MRLALTLLLLAACSTPAPHAEPAGEVDHAGYTCPMHPDVHADAPGKCPKCGMTLVPATGGHLEAHDHRSLHHGQVGMWGDHHVEYVGHDGEYRFWITNATRDPITTGISGTVKDGDQVLPLTVEADGSLSAKGEGAGTRPVMVEVTADGTTFSLSFNAE